MDERATIKELKEIVRKFTNERDWDQFHNAKDLAIGISTEAAELLELFRFRSNEEIEKMLEDPELKQKVSFEMSDVLYFILIMANRYNIDISEEFKKKVELSRKKYPVEKAKGKPEKYTEYQ